MSNQSMDDLWPRNFSGSVRVFPLADMVIFPHATQALHVFEPRYCGLVRDAMREDRLVAVGLPESEQSADVPRVAPVVCIGKIVADTALDDGSHNLMLLGLKRARIQDIWMAQGGYPQARVDVLDDVYPPGEASARPAHARRLEQLLAHLHPGGLQAQELFEPLFGREIPLGVLTDTIAFMLDLPVAIKQQLLAECNVDIRCRILTRCLEQCIAKRKQTGACDASPDFPPRFSDN